MSITEQHLKEIYSILLQKDCNILTISSPTGSGKSVKIPLYIASENNKTFVAIPTIFAVKSIYNYQHSNSRLTTEFKSKIGVAANTTREEIEYNKNSLLVYATTAHIKNKILASIRDNKAIDFCSILIVDEAHDPSFDTQLVLNLYNYAARSRMRVPKLIIMSATPVNFNFIPQLKIKSYKVKDERKFKVTVEYLDTTPDKNNIDDVIIEKINENINTKGHILVFLPGVPEILSLSNKLKTPSFSGFIVLELHSGTRDNVDVHRNYGNLRKIVLATNIAENSVTIEGVTLVIDTLLEKKTIEPSIEGTTRIISDYISKNSAIQRTGRTGRTTNGKCIRLSTEEFFENLNQETETELDRLPLHKIVMNIISYGLDPKNVLLSKYKNKVEQSINYLDSLNLLEENKKELNYRGRLCNNSLFSINNTLLVEESNIKYQLIVLFSIIENLSNGLIKKEFSGEDKEKYKSFIEYIIDLWNNFYTVFKYYGTDMDMKKLSRFCYENELGFYTFKEVLNIIQNQLTSFKNPKEVFLSYEDITNYLYKANNIIVLDTKDVIISKNIRVWGKNFNKVLVLSSFQSKGKIIVTSFLPIGKKKMKFTDNSIRYGLGNYFILEENITLSDEEKKYLLSLI